MKDDENSPVTYMVDCLSVVPFVYPRSAAVDSDINQLPAFLFLMKFEIKR